MEAINLDGLKKYYGKTRGVEDVTFSVKQGELFGFVGPNGAGKSTTIKLLLNFILPTAGTARIMGSDAVRESKQIKRFTSYIPSDVRYYEDMTVDELLRACASFYINHETAETNRLCEIFELDRGKRFRELSLGNRKKAAIVTALMARPRLLIADEPTGGLDPVMQKHLFVELRAQIKNGLTVLLSSHNLAEVEEHCDRAAFIKRGRILSVTDLKSTHRPQKLVSVWSSAPPDFGKHQAVLIGSDGDKRTYRYGGPPDALLRALTDAAVYDFTVERESLDKRFMSMYGDDEDKII